MAVGRVPAAPIGIIGNLGVDLILRGVRELPAWGEEVDVVDRIEAAAGQGGYLALGLSRLGQGVALMGIVGNDREGEDIRAALDAAGIDTAVVARSANRRTALAVAIVRVDGERAFVSDFGCQNELDEQFVLRSWPAIEACPVLCLVGSLNMSGLSLDAASRLLARARRDGATTVLDTGWDPAGWPDRTRTGMRSLLRETDVFLPNLQEAEVLTGTSDAATATEQLAEMGPRTVVVKCGRAGSYAIAEGERCHVEALEVDVHDAVGAGDAFNAGFLAARCRGSGLRPSMELASAAASLYVSRSTQRHPTFDEALAAARAYQ